VLKAIRKREERHRNRAFVFVKIKLVHTFATNKVTSLFFSGCLVSGRAFVVVYDVLAVSNVLTALIFSNSRNFETEGDTTRKLKPN